MASKGRVTLGLHRVHETRLGVTDRYVIFGEARHWMLSQLHLPKHSLILDVGFGHGFLSLEVASAIAAHVVGIDFLGGEQVKMASGGRRIANLTNRISWVISPERESKTV